MIRALLLVCLLTPTAWAFPSAEPESVGLSAESLDELAGVVQGYLDAEQVVGAELVVIKDRRTVLQRSFGWRDREEQLAMSADTIFNIRSMTKPVTGAAIQILIDEGKVALDDPAAKYLPGFDNEKSREITVEQLLTHTSGLPLTILLTPHQYESLQQMANAIGENGPQFPPGSKFWYSDAGTDVLGAIVEVASEQPLERFVRERLLEPLGMTDTFVAIDKDDPRWSRLASAYIGTPGSWNRYWSPSGIALYPFAWGSQTLYATTEDYARFLTLWLDEGMAGDKRLLSSAAIARTLAPAHPAREMNSDAPVSTGFPETSTYYGQMAQLWTREGTTETVAYGHSGSDGTFAWAWPEQDLMVLYFTQSRGGISGLSLERWIDELLINPRTHATDLSTLYAEIAGEYLADHGSVRDTTLRVFLSSGRPTIDLGRGRLIELRDPDAEGRWAFAISPRTSVSFTRNADGAIDAMRMHESGWSFESPRKGMPVAIEGDPAELQPYVGSYRVEAMDGTIDVVLSNGRLALDKSGLDVRTPVDLFELHRPDDEGRWIYRVHEGRSVTFAIEEGSVVSMTVYKDGEVQVEGVRVD